MHFKKNVIDPSIDLRKKITEFKPDLLAVSCTETTFHRGLRLISKTRDMGIKNIFGGVFATYAANKIIKNVSMLQVQLTEHYTHDRDQMRKKDDALSDLLKLIEMNL